MMVLFFSKSGATKSPMPVPQPGPPVTSNASNATTTITKATKPFAPLGK